MRRLVQQHLTSARDVQRRVPVEQCPAQTARGADAAGWNPRSRRLLVTSNTELNAIAAAAISGLRNPRGASGIAAVLHPNAQNRLP
jgi:hypothetical protein